MNDFVPHGKIVHVESCVRAEKERAMPPIVGILIVFILLFLILGIVISCVKIVPQSNCYVVERLGVYHEQTQPLIDFYTKKGVIAEVDGTKDMKDVFDEIVAILG